MIDIARSGSAGTAVRIEHRDGDRAVCGLAMNPVPASNRADFCLKILNRVLGIGSGARKSMAANRANP